MTSCSFVIAGISSGAGKTTVTIGLMAALKKRRLVVQPFKAGPDYIDSSHHAAVCGRPSYNLDTWMMGAEEVKNTFIRAMSGADAGIVEGAMGLFDGKDGKKEKGSAVHLAKVLNLRVILVVDAKGMAGSVAALVYGFENFDPEVNIAGVIFNRVGSERHFKMLKKAVENSCSARVFGYLPRDEEIAIPERHLGLLIASEIKGVNVDKLAMLMEQFVDIEGILGLDTGILAEDTEKKDAFSPHNPGITPRIAVACDNAFCFYYQQNLDILKESGAEIIFFSPLTDKRLPEKIDGIYLGGGYPEVHAHYLEANETLRNEIKNLAHKGIPIYAECGGLMYLGKGLIDLEGRNFEMVGIFPWTSKMLSKRKFLGYREVTVTDGCPFLERGQKIRGHEFHYSEMIPQDQIARTYLIAGAKEDKQKSEEGYLYKNTLASYVHLHFASNLKFAEGFVSKCRMAATKNVNNSNSSAIF